MTYLAHHPIVEALPAVVPMVLIVGAFAAIVVSDRRRARREAAHPPARDGEQGTLEG